MGDFEPYAAGVPAARSVAVRWLGHASVLIELAGVRVLTDPALTPRLAHLRRHHAIDATAIEPPDVILISHVHLDHLHVPSLRLFGSEVATIVPAGAAALLRRKGFRNVRETRAGSSTELGPLTIDTVPAVHPSSRGPHSRIAADAVGYIVRGGDAVVYFPGDTDLFDEMGTWDAIDLALLPIGGWWRTVGEGHLDPSRAARAVELIDPRHVLPVHWGTYSPIGLGRPAWLNTPAERFRAELDAAGTGDRLRLVTPGGTLVLPPVEWETHREPAEDTP
jgi:L-ascorbate metabolism protein UlaG (beta-lactamase superfamily)